MEKMECIRDNQAQWDHLEEQWHHVAERYMYNSLHNASKGHVEWVLNAANNNVVTAALVFGISVKEMMQLIQDLGIEKIEPGGSLSLCGEETERGSG